MKKRDFVVIPNNDKNAKKNTVVLSVMFLSRRGMMFLEKDIAFTASCVAVTEGIRGIKVFLQVAAG